MNLTNWKWFFVLIAQIAGAVFGSVLPKAMGATITKELKNEAWNECIVVHQFAYFGLCASFLTALTFKEPFPDLIVCFMLVTFVFFAVGLINTKTMLTDSRGNSKTAGQVKIIKNECLARCSFVCSRIDIHRFSARNGKPGPVTPRHLAAQNVSPTPRLRHPGPQTHVKQLLASSS